jgi:hypothetical protein
MTDTELYPRRRPRMYTPARDAFLRANPTVDPAILAAELGLAERMIYVYQRKLGIRICKYHEKKGRI